MTTGNHLILIAGTILLACAVLMLMPADEASGAETIYVDDNAGGGGDGSIENPYNRIQDGIDGTDPGDRVYVFNGSYKENVVVTHSLVLEGESREEVKLSGDGGLDVISVVGINSVTIAEMSVNLSDQDQGSGIGLMHSNNILVANVSVSDCFFGYYVFNTTNTVLRGIKATNCNRGMLAGSGSQAIMITDATFQLNKVYGVWVDGTYNLHMNNMTVRDNGDNGVMVTNSNMAVLNEVTSGMHQNGNGITLFRTHYSTLSDCAVDENNFGISLEESDGCRIERCTTESNDRGVTLEYANHTTIIDSIFRKNTAVGIYVYLSRNTYIYENLIELNDLGIKVHYSRNTLIPDNNTFHSNTYLPVFAQENVPPKAYVIADNTTVGLNQNIFFDASVSHDDDKDTPIVAYKIDFGDGNISDWMTEPFFNHSYDEYGNFTVKISVRDSVGNESENLDNFVYINVKKEKSTDTPFYVYGLVGLVVFLSMSVAYLGVRVQQLKQVDITEAFLIYGESGSLMCHARAPVDGDGGSVDESGEAEYAEGGVEGIGGEDGVDADVTIAMLSAIQDFIGDTFGRGDDSGIGRLEYGDSTIFIEKGKYVNLAVVASRSDDLIKLFLKKTVHDVESKHEGKLVQWNGDVSEMEKAKCELDELMTRKTAPEIIRAIFSKFTGGKGDKPQLPAGEETPPDVEVKPEPVVEQPPVIPDMPVQREEPAAMEPQPMAASEEPVAMEPQPAGAGDEPASMEPQSASSEPDPEYMEPLDPSG